MLKALLIRIGISTILFITISLIAIYAINKKQLEIEIKEMDLIQKDRLISEYYSSKKKFVSFLDILEFTFAESIQNFDNIDSQDIQAKLTKLAETFGLVELYIATLDGRLIALDEYNLNVLTTKRPWFMEVINGKELYLSEYYKSVTGSMVVTLSAPIKKNGRLIGVAGLDIFGTDFLSDHFIHALAKKDGDVFFTDQSFARFLGKNIYEERPDYLMATEEPLIYSNPEGEMFSVSKIELDDGYLLFSVLSLSKEIERNQANLIGFSAIMFIFIIVIMMVIFFMLSKELKVIKDISSLIRKIGEGQLINKSINAKYEFKYISKVISELVKKLSIVMAKSQKTMAKIKVEQNMAVQLAEKNKENSLNEFSFVEGVKSASTDLATTAMSVASNANKAEQATIEANSVIDSSQSILTNATEANEQINTSFFEAKETVNHLREHSEKISTVVDVIKNISEQTNLLALNAAIEAARAGAQGRGFAVVADEVRALAAKTQKSTVDIQNIISQLQEKSKHANDYMNKNVELMKLTQESMEELKHSFEVISSKVAGISQINTTVAAASEKQNVVTQEISKQLENMNSLVQQNLESIGLTSQSNKEVSNLAELLQSELSFFKVEK